MCSYVPVVVWLYGYYSGWRCEWGSDADARPCKFSNIACLNFLCEMIRNLNILLSHSHFFSLSSGVFKT